MRTDSRVLLARWLGITGLLAPTGLVALGVLMRCGVFKFRDDFTGFVGLGFFLYWGGLLVLAGLACSILSLVLGPRSTRAVLGLAVNAGLFLAGLSLRF